MTTLDEVERWLDALAASPSAVRTFGVMSPSQALLHGAQSIGYSLRGYPRLRPRLLRLTVGKLAFAVFSLTGSMRHDVDGPIPGAPPVPSDGSLAEGIDGLRQAIAEFRAENGPLAPHFLFGKLDRKDYELAHAIHIADHARRFSLPPR